MLPLLIEPSDLHVFLEQDDRSDLLLVDLGTEARYLDTHIPGAVLVSPGETQAIPPVAPGKLPSDQALAALMQRIGLTPQSHVVVYDDEGGGWAGRFIWMLDEIGHTNYCYLNGGLVAWLGEGYETTCNPTKVKPSTIMVRANHRHTITLEQLVNSLADPSLQIWDARSPAEYRGEQRNAARAGHIPGAINYEWTRAMDQYENLRLKALDKLAAELASVGLTPDQQLVVHCQSHHRSGLAYLVAKTLGFASVKAYAGSWGEWGNRNDTPIEL